MKNVIFRPFLVKFHVMIIGKRAILPIPGGTLSRAPLGSKTPNFEFRIDFGVFSNQRNLHRVITQNFDKIEHFWPKLYNLKFTIFTKFWFTWLRWIILQHPSGHNFWTKNRWKVAKLIKGVNKISYMTKSPHMGA